MDNTITVNKVALIEKLRTNLSTHTEKVEQAQGRYRQKVTEELERRLADAKAGRPLDVAVLARMPVPRSFADEYEQAIDELDWHTSDVVELTSRDFRRFVRDDWEWANQFAGTTQTYLVE